MALNCTLIKSRLNAAPSELIQDLNVFLALNNPMSLLSVWYRGKGKTKLPMQIDVTWEDLAGATYIALLFQGDGTASADQKAQAYFVADPTFQAAWVLDLSNPYQRSLVRDAVAIVGVPDQSIDLRENIPMAVVRPQADIAVDAIGPADVLGATGPLMTAIQVQNRHGFLWDAGRIGWAAVDPITQVWQGHPGCCK
jgi:hypothetical protein